MLRTKLKHQGLSNIFHMHALEYTETAAVPVVVPHCQHCLFLVLLYMVYINLGLGNNFLFTDVFGQTRLWTSYFYFIMLTLQTQLIVSYERGLIPSTEY